MQTPSILARTLGAALAVVCSAGLLGVVSEQLNPVRLAATPQVIQFEPVVITAPARATGSMAAAEARTAAN